MSRPENLSYQKQKRHLEDWPRWRFFVMAYWVVGIPPGEELGDETFFTVLRRPCPVGMKWHDDGVRVCNLTIGIEIDEKCQLKVGEGHRLVDERSICSVTHSHSAGSDFDDGEFSGRKFLDNLGMPEVVEAETHIPFGVFPPTSPKLMANEHVEMTTLVVFETEHSSEGERMGQFEVSCKVQADTSYIAEIGIHPDDNIPVIVRAGDITSFVANDHLSSPRLKVPGYNNYFNIKVNY